MLFEQPLNPVYSVDLTDLVVHDDSVGRGVQQCGLSEQLPLLVLVLLPVTFLDIVRSQCVQRSHLVSLKVRVIQACICAGGIQDLDKVLDIVLFVILKLKSSTTVCISV